MFPFSTVFCCFIYSSKCNVLFTILYNLSTLSFPSSSLHHSLPHCRCTIDDRVTRVAWLNRSTILYAGNDKWSIDPRVIILVNTPTQYSIMIQNVDVYDEGPYTCSVQTDNHPKTSRVHLIVQGKSQLDLGLPFPSVMEGTNSVGVCSTCVRRHKSHLPLLNPEFDYMSWNVSHRMGT